MKNLIKNIKDLVTRKNEIPLSEAFEIMHDELDQAEKDFGREIFPKDEVLSPEEVHYKALKLKKGAPFELIQEHYEKLKEKYNPENYKDDEKKYKKAKELYARVEFAYSYFTSKTSD